MENKKCPICGKIMRYEINNSAINYYCDFCKYSETTTYYDSKIWDISIYEIIIKENKNINLDKIKVISHITGLNFIESKKILTYGGILCKNSSSIIEQNKKKLDSASIKYETIKIK